MERNELFVITHDHLSGEKLGKEEIAELKKAGYTSHFKLYDDDEIKYYSGYLNEKACEDADHPDYEFIPLDWAMGDSGCTDIKYKNKETGKYHSL